MRPSEQVVNTTSSAAYISFHLTTITDFLTSRLNIRTDPAKNVEQMIERID